MKYKMETIIDAPREHVIRQFDDPANLIEWQPDFVSFTHLSGKLGHVGATSKLLYKMGNREVELIETIISRNLPDEFSGTYETKGMVNSISNIFEQVGTDQTRWSFTCEFSGRGMMGLMLLLMPGMFKKRSNTIMQNFKGFAERTMPK